MVCAKKSLTGWLVRLKLNCMENHYIASKFMCVPFL